MNSKNLKIILSNKMKWELVLFFLIWIIIGVLLPKESIFKLDPDNYLFSSLWLLIYLLISTYLALNMIWRLLGYIEISLDTRSDFLIVKKKILFFTLERVFEIKKIKHLKYEADFETNYWQTKILTGFKFFATENLKISFIYNKEKIWIGENLTMTEVDLILNSLKAS